MSDPDRQPPCPKCGYDEYRTRYIAPAKASEKPWLLAVGVDTNEYLRYRCERCHFLWRGDCLDAEPRNRPDAADREWRCVCGATKPASGDGSPSPQWRWNGEEWTHSHQDENKPENAEMVP